jgi:hypothetical protein
MSRARSPILLSFGLIRPVSSLLHVFRLEHPRRKGQRVEITSALWLNLRRASIKRPRTRIHIALLRAQESYSLPCSWSGIWARNESAATFVAKRETFHLCESGWISSRSYAEKARLFWSKQQHDSLSGVKSYSWYFVICLVLFFLSPD